MDSSVRVNGDDGKIRDAIAEGARRAVPLNMLRGRSRSRCKSLLETPSDGRRCEIL